MDTRECSLYIFFYLAENNFFKLFRIYGEIHNSVFLKLCISTKIIVKSFKKNIFMMNSVSKYDLYEFHDIYLVCI